MTTTEKAGPAHYVHKECGGVTIWDLSGGFCVKCHAEGLEADDVDRREDGTVTTTEQAEGSAWPADGSAGICPDCAGPVYYAGEPGSHGVWYHDSGSERCDD